METWVNISKDIESKLIVCRRFQNTLSKGYYVNPNGKAFKTGSLQSPTHSYSSSEGGNYAIMDNRIKVETSPNEVNNHNRYSAPLNYQGDEPSSRAAGNGLNNRRSAPEFLTENWSSIKSVINSSIFSHMTPISLTLWNQKKMKKNNLCLFESVNL